MFHNDGICLYGWSCPVEWVKMSYSFNAQLNERDSELMASFDVAITSYPTRANRGQYIMVDFFWCLAKKGKLKKQK